uniref:Histone-lysine N-methyltransferase SUVR4 n=1 Tax=Vitis vinifera TaxID=29760 RepID=A5BDE8_VITVI|nr:hypothetical protein VITISV_002899 [Vitis vinifera]
MEAVVSLLSILQGKRLFVGLEDRVLWNASKNEIFFVKSLYNTLDSSGSVPFPWRIIWSPCVPTKVLGIPERAVKPALKKLLDLYDGNWELIEAENYRALADAIFEYEEAKGLEDNEGAVSCDESEPPLKRSHRGQQENQVSSRMERSSTMWLPEKGEIAPKNFRQERMDSSRSSLKDRRRVTSSDSCREQFDDKKKCTTSSEIAAKDVKSTSERASSTVHFKQPMGGSNGALIIGTSKKGLNKMELRSSSDSFGLDVDSSQALTFCKRRSIHDINDITKGAENVKISLVDEIGSEGLPNFFYLPENTIYQNAYLHFSLARISDEDCCSSCSDNCLSSLVPCACARETAGEFAYTPRGLLKRNFLDTYISMSKEPQKHHYFYCEDCPLERSKNQYLPDPCKGHLVRKFIKECWRKCGCSMYCGNRIVQRGITFKLQVFMTHEGKGWGLRTLEALPKGAFVCEYVGEILTNMELYERNKQSNGNDRHTYPVLLDADWGSEGVLKDEEALCLDATFYGNVARFINHRDIDDSTAALHFDDEFFK